MLTSQSFIPSIFFLREFSIESSFVASVVKVRGWASLLFAFPCQCDLSSDVVQSPDSSLREILSGTVNQIKNNPGISKQGRSHSDRCGPGQDKFNDILPGHNPAHPNNRNPHGLVHIPNHLDRDGLD